MKIFGSAVIAAASLMAAVPASAQTYDAFTSFDGTQGGPSLANKFIYGQADPSSPGTPGVGFTANTNCFIDGAICLQQAPNHDVPGVAKGGTPAFQYGTVNVPNDRLLVHPANTSDLTYAAFVAPTAGTYKLVAYFNIQDTKPTGVDIYRVGTTSGGLPLTFAQIGSLSSGSPTFSDTQLVSLVASEAIGYAIGNGGSYFDDSTGFNFTVTAVPEPATWGLMILGFGLVGAAMRRRQTAKVAAIA